MTNKSTKGTQPAICKHGGPFHDYTTSPLELAWKPGAGNNAQVDSLLCPTCACTFLLEKACTAVLALRCIQKVLS